MDTNLACQEETWEELIDGKVIAMSPASVNHNRISYRIFYIFEHYLRGKECEPFGDGTAVYLGEKDFYIPDVMVVCKKEKIREDGVYGAPDLVVEVLTPGTARYDKGRKKDVYEKSGVCEYWLVSPADRSIEQWILRDGRFVLNDIYSIYPDFLLARMKPAERAAIRTEFKCSLYDDLTIRLEDVFYRVN